MHKRISLIVPTNIVDDVYAYCANYLTSKPIAHSIEYKNTIIIIDFDNEDDYTNVLLRYSEYNFPELNSILDKLVKALK